MAGIRQVQTATYPLAIDFGQGLIVKVKMKPHADGQREAVELRRKLEESEDPDESARLIRGKFLRTITEWDLEDFRCAECKAQLNDTNSKCAEHPEAKVVGPNGADGWTIPLSEEGLEFSNVPPTLLSDIVIRGYEDLGDKKKRGKRG